MCLFTSKIVGVGISASEFLSQKMIVTFYENAPAALKDFCYLIDELTLTETVKVSDFLVVDGVSYQITFVGDQVENNLEKLGHVTISFNGDTKGLPGMLCVEDKEIIDLKVGTTLKIKKGWKSAIMHNARIRNRNN